MPDKETIRRARQDAAQGKSASFATPPEFRGILRATLPERVEARVAASVEKDYLHLDPPSVRERLEQQLEAR